jgi:hypothetical protein
MTYRIFYDTHFTEFQNMDIENAKIFYRQKCDEFKEIYSSKKSNITPKKYFSELLIAENYFRNHVGLQPITKQNLIDILNSPDDGDLCWYLGTGVNLDNPSESEEVTFNKTIDGKYWHVKIKNKVITDFFKMNEVFDGENRLWVQYNPETMEVESYYENVLSEDGQVISELKFDAITKQVHSEAHYITSFDQLPDDFKQLTENFENKETVSVWSRKPRGRVVAYIGTSRQVDPEASAVDDFVVLSTPELETRLYVVECIMNVYGDETWEAVDTSTWD